jgi:predicted nucleotidyltransferase
LAIQPTDNDATWSSQLRMPADKVRMLSTIAENLRNVPNVVAVVLGGSYALGLAGPNSDIDIGVYYREASPFAIDEIRSVAERISLTGSTPTVTGLYGWGPWVNGGAWIRTALGKVDFLYRNVDQIQTVIEEGHRGVWRHDYDQQPPYGFRSIVYFGETHNCVPLYDPDGQIARLKQSVAEYPDVLKDRIIQDSLWGAEFSFLFLRGFSAAGDPYNAVGCATRIAQFLIHALFALNRKYFATDKYAACLVDQFALRPQDFTARLARVLSSPGRESAELVSSAELLRALWLETVDLTNGKYKPQFDLRNLAPE